MAIKGGSILHVGNGTTVIDRIQTGGPGQLNIPTEKIYELGNFRSVAIIRDVPDLSFSMESYDVSTEVEALLTKAYAGRNVTDAVTTDTDATVTSATAVFVTADVGRMVIFTRDDGTEFVSTIVTRNSATSIEVADVLDFTDTAVPLRITQNGIDLVNAVPNDFAGQFKAGLSAASPYLVTASVALPFLNLEQMGYRFGIRDNAMQSASLKGDAIFYNPGATYIEETAGSGTASQAVVTAHSAYAVAEGDERRVLSVTAGTRRLAFGIDYVETYGSIVSGAAVTTVTLVEAVATTDNVRVVYSSPNALSYAQNVHADATVKPAAVKGIDIDVYVGGYDPNDIAGSAVNKFRMVQSINTDWRVTLEKDEEFGNHYAVDLTFETPTVNGSVTVKPRDPAELLSLVRKVQGVSDATKVLGPASSTPLALDIVIKHPETGASLKRLHVPDARFTVPGYSGRVQQQLTTDLTFESDNGTLVIYER